MRVVIIDNYDSFTYNLVYLLRDIGIKNLDVFRNDEYDLEKISSSDKIMFSPGPGIPSEAGDMLKLIGMFYQHKSILGVCLGHQAIGEFFGAKIKQLDYVYHGVSTEVTIDNQSDLFKGLDSKISVGRYHSWVIDSKNIPNVFKVTSRDEANLVMAINHKTLPIYGVQFHPESIMTNCGAEIIKNWINS